MLRIYVREHLRQCRREIAVLENFLVDRICSDHFRVRLAQMKSDRNAFRAFIRRRFVTKSSLPRP